MFMYDFMFMYDSFAKLLQMILCQVISDDFMFMYD